MYEQAHERRRGEPRPRRGCGEAGPAPPIAFGMSPQVPRPQTPRLCPVSPVLCVCGGVCVGGGVAGGGADGADSRPRARPGLLPRARLGLPGSTSLINQVPGSASGEADPRQMPSAGSQARTRGEWGHGRGQVCPQQEEEGRPSRDSKS